MLKARRLSQATKGKKTAKLQRTGNHQQEGQIKFVVGPMDQQAMSNKALASSDRLVQGSVSKHHSQIVALMAPGVEGGTVMRVVLAATGVSSQMRLVRYRSGGEAAVASEGAVGHGTMMNMILGHGQSAVTGTGAIGIAVIGIAVIGTGAIGTAANEIEATGTEVIGIAVIETGATGTEATGIEVIETEVTGTVKTGTAAETAPNGTVTETVKRIVIGATVSATGVTKIAVIATEVTGTRIGIAVTATETTRIGTAAIGIATRTGKKTATEVTKTVIGGTESVTGVTRIVAKGVNEAVVEGTTGGVEIGSEVRAAVTGLQNGCHQLALRRLLRQMAS